MPPVKIRWIPFYSFRGEVENVSANQRSGRPSCFSDRPEKHKLGVGRWDLDSCQVFLLLFWTRWMEFNETWQEARSQRPLPCLYYSGWSGNKNGRPSRVLKKGGTLYSVARYVALWASCSFKWSFSPCGYIPRMLESTLTSNSKKCDPTRRKLCRTHSFVFKKHFLYFSEHLFCSIRQLTCLHHVERIISTLYTICTVSEPPLIYKDFIVSVIQCARATSPLTNNELSGLIQLN